MTPDTAHETAEVLSAAERLSRLRAQLEAENLDGFILLQGDEFQGEFVAPYAERLAWLTGFTGSAGMAVVLHDRAALFVDGRYTLQVRDQADDTLYAFCHLTDHPPSKWIKETLKSGQSLGYDPHLFTPDQLKRLREACEKAGGQLVPVAANPVDVVWTTQPPRPRAPVKVHPLQLAGQSHADKRAAIAKKLAEDGHDAYLITASDVLCWLLNVRGGDIEFTPLVLAMALLYDDGRVTLFIDDAKLTPEVRAHLGDDVTVAPADGLGVAIDAMSGEADHIAVDKATVSQWAVDRLEAAGLTVTPIEDPCALPKACKNDVEVAGIRAAHVRDGAALTRFLAWLDREVAAGAHITEISAAKRLETFRRADNMFQGPSFPTIAGAGANGAIVHYRSTPETDAAVAPDMLFLVDSGGQYLDGTTDVTRTIAIGTPTAEQRRRFTQVLKGHIALAMARFPEGTSGGQLDGFARAALWEDGVDYDHGTGHGVGAYLGVHEGPQRISKASLGPALKPGMVISNEPGYYKTGEFGIRIENLVVVRESAKPNGAEKGLLDFETLTLAPIDLRLIDVSLLSDAEKGWLNAYHARVRDTLMPLVGDDVGDWLTDATRPL